MIPAVNQECVVLFIFYAYQIGFYWGCVIVKGKFMKFAKEISYVRDLQCMLYGLQRGFPIMNALNGKFTVRGLCNKTQC